MRGREGRETREERRKRKKRHGEVDKIRGRKKLRQCEIRENKKEGRRKVMKRRETGML